MTDESQVGGQLLVALETTTRYCGMKSVKNIPFDPTNNSNGYGYLHTIVKKFSKFSAGEGISQCL